MERISISIEPGLAREFDQFIGENGYSNRSEAIRDLIRQKLEESRIETWDEGDCVATLSYVFNHHEMDLGSKITDTHHSHHDLTHSSMHIHLDHHDCLEITVLHGSIREVRKFASEVIAHRGVRHGKLHIVPVEVSQKTDPHHSRPHTHSTPKT